MDIEKITYFFTAADLGSFTQAAKRCGITQTAMSKYILTLENDLGCSLFFRTNKGCSLTTEGRLFYDGMKELYDGYQRLRADVAMAGENVLWVGFEGDHIMSVPQFIAFEEKYPNIGIAVTFGKKEALIESLRAGKCDALMLFDTVTGMKTGDKKKGFDTIALPGVIEEFICSKQALERYGSPEGVIKELPLVTQRDSEQYHEYCRRGLMDKFGTSFRRVIYIDSISKQHLIVSLSRGFAIVPDYEIEDDSYIVSIPLNSSYVTSMEFVYNKQSASPELRKLAEFIRGESRR